MLRSLLLTGDAQSACVLARAFKELEVELKHCAELATALKEIHKHRYDAVLIDDAVEGAHAIGDEFRASSASAKSICIMLAQAGAPIEVKFKASTQIILYKPLTPERVRTGLRAVRNLMSREQRRGTKRVGAMLLASISPRHARRAPRQALITDLSASGAALSCEPEDLPVTTLVNLDFSLPDSLKPIHATAELIWQDRHGSAGFRFVDMPSSERRRLTEWVKEHSGLKQGENSAIGYGARSARAGLP
jgi:hypothetical protein